MKLVKPLPVERARFYTLLLGGGGAYSEACQKSKSFYKNSERLKTFNHFR